MKKQIALMSVLSPLAATAQNDSIMYGNDKMNVVIGVITIIFIGLGAYLFSLDKKIKKLEDEKYAEFEKLGETASEIKRNAKITEIQDLQQRIENYRTSASQQIQQKQAEIENRIYDDFSKKGNSKFLNPPPYTLPVVIHIIHQNGSEVDGYP